VFLSVFLASAGFHCFNAMSFKVKYWMRVLDLSGIAFQCIGVQWPFMHCLFYCYPELSKLYTPLLILLFFLGSVPPFFIFLHTPRFKPLRIAIFVSLALFPLVMSCHALMIFGFDMNHHTFRIYKALFLTYITFAIGVFFYASHYPECKKPGHFDVWGNSHQIWHVLAFLGSYVWYQGFTEYMEWRLQTPCQNFM